MNLVGARGRRVAPTVAAVFRVVLVHYVFTVLLFVPLFSLFGYK